MIGSARSCAIPWLPVCAPKIRRVDEVCRSENSVNEAAVERSVNWIRDNAGLALQHRCTDGGEVEAEIQNNDCCESEQNLFGASSHYV